MLLALLGYSFVPLLIIWSRGSESPFLFNGCLTLGLVFSYLPYILVMHRDLLAERRFYSLVWRRLFPHGRILSSSSIAFFLMVVNNFEFALYSWSARFVDISVTAILFETWPIVLVFLIGWLYRDEVAGGFRFRALSFEQFILLLLGFVGFVFVVLCQYGRAEGLGSIRAVGLVVGLTLAIAASGVTSLSAFGFRWGTDLSSDLRSRGISEKDSRSLDLLGVVVVSILANVLVVPANFAVGIFTGEEMLWSGFLIGLLGGAVCSGVSTLCWRKANLMTSNPGVNALAYGTPVFSLLLLISFGLSEVARVDYLVMGTIAIVVANLLINFEAGIR